MENTGEMCIYWRELEFLKMCKFNVLEISNVNYSFGAEEKVDL